jgi:hypothetical protein
MNPIPPGQRRICMVVDIEKYSARLATDHLAMQSQLRKMVESAVEHAGLRWSRVDVQNQGDGLLLQLPAAIDEPHVLPRLINGLCLALQQSNMRALSVRRLRLRMALTQGIQHPGPTGAIGDSLIAACRLVDSPAARSALEARPDRSLVVIVSDDLYRDVVAQRYPGLNPAEFEQVQAEIPAKNFRACAWVHIPVPGEGQLTEPSPLESPTIRRAAQLARDVAPSGAAAVVGGMVGGAMIHYGHHTPLAPPAHPGEDGHGPGDGDSGHDPVAVPHSY